ncbi:MAG: hypothetical protein ACE5KG_06255 [Nitrososphaerales archaeon]
MMLGYDGDDCNCSHYRTERDYARSNASGLRKQRDEAYGVLANILEKLKAPELPWENTQTEYRASGLTKTLMTDLIAQRDLLVDTLAYVENWASERAIKLQIHGDAAKKAKARREIEKQRQEHLQAAARLEALLKKTAP